MGRRRRRGLARDLLRITRWHGHRMGSSRDVDLLTIQLCL